MHAMPRSPPIFSYARGVYEGGGKPLGEITTRTRLIEPRNAQISEQNAKEEIGGDVT